jgi:hypothetical protein
MVLLNIPIVNNIDLNMFSSVIQPDDLPSMSYKHHQTERKHIAMIEF